LTLSDKESEADIRFRYIDPMLREGGWQPERILLERPYSAGKIVPEGRGGTRIEESIKKPDYVLEYAPNIKIAVIEAKSSYKTPGDGIQQAIDYAMDLKIKFVYSSNGKGIVEYDFTKKVNAQRKVDKIPSPEELWARLNQELNLNEEQKKTFLLPLNKESDTPEGKIKEARYYQENAINATMQAILNGKKQVLLTLATGTGKTFIAFQIAWKLWNSGKPKPKILYLVDRDVLLKQAFDKDFKPFGPARWRIQKTANKSYDIYFALYQALDVDKEESQLYKLYEKNFFDYVMVDECHRGVSAAESSWREILDHFSDAVHIGMTATPSRKNEIDDTFRYFGHPVYEYSLKQGIEDGFLAPFVIDRRVPNYDVNGYIPKKGELDNFGNPLDKPAYFRDDFDNIITVKSRQEEVADAIINHLGLPGNKYDKTIVFCQKSKHAEEMTQLLRNKAGEGPTYCVRIVSLEGEVGKDFLDKFSNPKEKLPVIAVTSRMMSTGVDAPTCRNIVLDKTIRSMTEFKQIIGRGTRVYELQDKLWFTIMDFREATELFDDPDWDGPPAPPPAPIPGQSGTGGNIRPPRPPILEVDGEKVQILARHVTIFDPAAEGGQRLVSFEQFTGNTVKRLEADFGMELKEIWIDIPKRKRFIIELRRRGITVEHIQQITEKYDADIFDILRNLAYGTSIKTRKQRVGTVKSKKGFLEKNPGKAREVIEVLMDLYAEYGPEELEPEDTKVLKLDKFEKYGGDYAIVNDIFKGIDNYKNTVNELIHQIYEA